MLKTEMKQVSKNMFKKNIEYVEPVRTGATAKAKETIVSQYSESKQLNLLRKAILGDTIALSELQSLEDLVNDIK
jgi:hypothetical protein